MKVTIYVPDLVLYIVKHESYRTSCQVLGSTDPMLVQGPSKRTLPIGDSIDNFRYNRVDLAFRVFYCEAQAMVVRL